MHLVTRIALFLLNELVAALRANVPDLLKRRISGAIQCLGRPAVEELMLEWMNPLLTVDEMDRLKGSESKLELSMG